MAKTLVTILSLLFMIALSFTVVNGGGPTSGGKTPIDVMTKEVQDLGRFAVEEYNKRNLMRVGWTPLAFSRVVEGQTQVVDGAFYYLKLEATENGVTNKYDAEVLVKTWENPPKSLLSFTPST